VADFHASEVTVRAQGPQAWFRVLSATTKNGGERVHSRLAAHQALLPFRAMKVSFTPKEYARLLELAHLGLWVAGARPDDPATMPERYAELAQKLYALAEPFGCADLVETDVNGQIYAAEKLTTGPAQEKLDQFIEDTFWSELVGRLAERDLQMELGPTKLTPQLTTEESARLDEMEDRYWGEFEQSGVDHLVLLRGGRG
jgi:hypothetical protein